MASLIEIPQNPTPSNAKSFDFTSADNAKLRCATFEVEKARATIVLMSGRSEFIEKYFEVISELQSRGFSVAMMDWRGQGLSERLLPDSEKGHITNFGAFRSDLTTFVEEHVFRKLSGPYILMTHSMGGAPALQILGSGYDKFDAAVLCAPMTRLYASVIKHNVIKIVVEIACRLGWSRTSIPGVKEHSLDFEGNVLTSDEPRHRRFEELQAVAPNAIIREPTFGWVKAAVDCMDDIHSPDRFGKLTTPILIISAEKDDLIHSPDHHDLATRHNLINVISVKGAKHEILMEQDIFRRAYWEAFDAFIEPIISKNTTSK